MLTAQDFAVIGHTSVIIYLAHVAFFATMPSMVVGICIFALMGIAFHFLQEDNPWAMFSSLTFRLKSILSFGRKHPYAVFSTALGAIAMAGLGQGSHDLWLVHLGFGVTYLILLVPLIWGIVRLLRWKPIEANDEKAPVVAVIILCCVFVVIVVPFHLDKVANLKSEIAQQNHDSDEPMDRGYPHVVQIEYNINPMGSSARVVMQNVGRYRIISPWMSLGRIIGSPPLLGPDEETKHLFSGQENGMRAMFSFPGNSWDPGDSKAFTIREPFFAPNEWKEISECTEDSCKRRVYIVTKTFSSDKFGKIPPKESCYYVSAVDWDHLKKCYGHND